MRRSFIILIVLFFQLECLFSQITTNQKIIHYTTNNGLSNGKIHQIAQDKQGFVWIATENGLTRYDGNQSKTYNSVADANMYGISHNYVYAVSAANNYGVWVGTMAGLDKYNHATGKFSHYYFYNENKKSYLKPVWQIIPISSGHCFIRSDSRELYYYTPGNDTLHVIPYKNFKPKALPQCIDSISKNAIIVGDKKGFLYQVTLQGNVTIIDSIPHSISWLKVLPNNTICVADIFGTVYMYKNMKRKASFSFPQLNIPISEKYISTIEQLNDSLLLIGTRGAGMYRFHISKGWRNKTEISSLLINSHIESIFRDTFHNVWVGHSYGGVSLSLYQYQSFHILDCPAEVFQYKILSLNIHNQNIYIGTDGNGLYIYNLLTKKLQHYNFDSGYQGFEFDNVITSMHADKTHLWLSTYNKGVFAIDLKTQKLSFYQDLKRIPVFEISNVYNDSNNRLWLGTYDDGVYVFDKSKKQIIAHYTTKGNLKLPPITCNGITCFFEDSKNNMWIGTYYGISKIKTNNEIQNYTYNTHKGIKNNVISTFHEDPSGKVWIGTAQGLSMYDEKQDTILAFVSKHNVNMDIVNGMFSDEKNMWIISQQALYKYYSDINNFKFIGSSNLGDFSREAFCKDNNTLYLGTEKGIICIDYLKNKISKQNNKIELTDIIIEGKSLFTQNSEYEAKFENGEYHISLPYMKDNLTLYFTDFIFDNKNGEEYSYKLENYMDEWTPLNEANFVNFTKLPGGEYIFKVRKNSLDDTDNTELRVYIHVQKALWEQWYFYMFLGLILIALVYLVYSIRVSRIISMRNTLQKMVEQRMEEIQLKIEMINFQDERIKKQNEISDIQNAEIEKQKVENSRQKQDFQLIINEKDEEIAHEQHEKQFVEDEKNAIEQNFHLIENKTKEMVFRILLPSEQFDYVSPAAESLTGYSPQEFYGDSMIFRKLVVSEGKDDFKKFRKYMIEGKVPPIMEYKIITKDESEKWVAQHSSIIKDAKNQVIALEAVLIDISDKKELEQRYEAAQKRSKKATKITEVYQDVSHVNKAKSAITIFSEFLNQEDLSLDEKRAFLEINHESSSYMLQMIEDLIDISKIEAGKLHLNYSQCYVNSIMQELYDSFLETKNEMNKKNISLNLIIPSLEETFSFYTDTFRFRQIMMNLIGNAFKYTQQGSVEFGYEFLKNTELESNIELVFFIKDTGKGISQEQFKNLVDKNTTANQENPGIGLAVSCKLVELLGGKIWVESTENKGSTFKFTLPMEKMKGLKKIDVPIIAKELEYKDWSGKTLLLAEDEENNYDLVREVLLKTKIEVIWVANGELAVEMFKEKQREIDIILMDIQMPIMNGYIATQEIKKIDKEIPIIAQTAYANYESKLNCIKVGCDNYIEKPYKKKDLIELLAKYL